MKGSILTLVMAMLIAGMAQAPAYAESADDEFAGFETTEEASSEDAPSFFDFDPEADGESVEAGRPAPIPGATAEGPGVSYILSKSRDLVVVPEGIPEFHTVVHGDTLWGISGLYLNDNYLWPLIWELNIANIPNPHLIFPGQIVYLPQPGVFTQGGVPAAPTDIVEDPLDQEPGDFFAEAPEEIEEEDALIEPVLTDKEMESIGYIVPTRSDCQFKIIGAELYQEFAQATEDIVYLNIGANDDAAVGDKFYAFNYQRRVIHPITGKFVGWYVNNFGILEIICVFEKISMAVITEAWEPINIGDCIAPYAPLPSPWLQATGLTRCSLPQEERKGYIIDAKLNFTGAQENVFSAEGDIVYIDLGFEDNISNGDYFMIYIDRGEGSTIPDLPIGEMIVLRATENFATCYITKSLYEADLGTAVDYMQFTRADVEGLENPDLFGRPRAPSQMAGDGSVQ